MADKQFHRLSRKDIVAASFYHVIDRDGGDGWVSRRDLEERILSLVPQVPDYHDYPLAYNNSNLPDEALLSAEEPDQSGYRALTIRNLEKRFLDTNNPVGTVRIFQGQNANPATLFGIGIWSRTASGRAIVGAGSSPDENNVKHTMTDGQKLGEYEVALTVAEMPEHTHAFNTQNRDSSRNNSIEKSYSGYSYNPFQTIPHTTSSAGRGNPHNNIQPSEVYTCWKRVV